MGTVDLLDQWHLILRLKLLMRGKLRRTKTPVLLDVFTSHHVLTVAKVQRVVHAVFAVCGLEHWAAEAAFEKSRISLSLSLSMYTVYIQSESKVSPL